MKIKTKKMIRRKLMFLLKWCMIMFIVVLIYSMGNIYGTVNGLSLGLGSNNQTVCDLMEKERIGEFCILRENAKYNWYTDCGWEKFMIKGEQKPPLIVVIAERIRQLIFYPALGCI